MAVSHLRPAAIWDFYNVTCEHHSKDVTFIRAKKGCLYSKGCHNANKYGRYSACGTSAMLHISKICRTSLGNALAICSILTKTIASFIHFSKVLIFESCWALFYNFRSITGLKFVTVFCTRWHVAIFLVVCYPPGF